jgi:hypothetical protein
MNLALVNHVADDAHTLRVWAGIAYSHEKADPLWKISGKVVQATTVRAMSSWNPKNCKPFQSGVFEFHGLQADTRYDVELCVAQEKISRVFKTLPEKIPSVQDKSFNLLLLSCFHGAQDATGTGGRVLSTFKPRPDLTIFAGDQVYLDLPTLRNFQDQTDWLQEKFLNDYLANWFGATQTQLDSHEVPAGFPQMLSLGPIVTIPDDHEYWNNAPFSSPFIQNSWTEAGRKRWVDAAELGFGMFQNGSAQALGSARHLRIAPLSILILDTRSQRNRGVGNQPDSASMREAAGDLLGLAGRTALTEWADDLIANAGSAQPSYGVLVTGQSLFTQSAGKLKGSIADFEFPDYAADYQFLMEEVQRVSRAGLPIVCLTGDVHWGRILRAAGPPGSAPLYEVISSPTSLVESIGADQVANAIGRMKGLFGNSDPWPRHHETEQPPPRFGSDGAYAPDFVHISADKKAAMRGNMALMLRFQSSGPALNVEVEYIPLHKKNEVNATNRWSVSFELRPLS